MHERLRVLLAAVDLMDEGGVASYVRAVRPHFKVQVDVVTVGSRPANPGKLEWVKRLLRDWWKFWRAANSGRYDVVHLNPSLESRALLRDGVEILLARLAGIPVVVFMHGWVPECEAKLRRPIARALFARTFLRVAHMVVLASAFEDTLRSWGRRGPVTVLGTAVEDGVLCPEPRRPSPSDRSFVALFLARLDVRKGALTAVRTQKVLRQRGRNVELVIAGDGPAYAGVRANAGPGVRFVGYVRGADKLAVLDEADVFLFPTEYGEGLPIAILEAMARGLPIVSRTVGGIPDVVEQGTMGFLTESTDPAIFADLIEELIDNPPLRQGMARTNRHVVESRFTGEAAARALEQVYASVTRVPRGRT